MHLLLSNGIVVLYSKCQQLCLTVQVQSGNRKIWMPYSRKLTCIHACLHTLTQSTFIENLLRSLVAGDREKHGSDIYPIFLHAKCWGVWEWKSASMMSIFSCKRAIRHMAVLQHKSIAMLTDWKTIATLRVRRRLVEQADEKFCLCLICDYWGHA